MGQRSKRVHRAGAGEAAVAVLNERKTTSKFDVVELVALQCPHCFSIDFGTDRVRHFPGEVERYHNCRSCFKRFKSVTRLRVMPGGPPGGIAVSATSQIENER